MFLREIYNIEFHSSRLFDITNLKIKPLVMTLWICIMSHVKIIFIFFYKSNFI